MAIWAAAVTAAARTTLDYLEGNAMETVPGSDQPPLSSGLAMTTGSSWINH